jgi:hypothetical protein
MQQDRLKSHYGGMFNVDKSDDIKIDEILRQALSRPFETDALKLESHQDKKLVSKEDGAQFAKT